MSCERKEKCVARKKGQCKRREGRWRWKELRKERRCKSKELKGLRKQRKMSKEREL